MDETAHGIILRVRPLTESSLIIHWLTEEAGRIATVAKGARRPKSVYRGKIDLFFTATFTFQRSRRSELHTLRELEMKASAPTLRTNIEYLQQAAYCAALIEQVSETDTPVPELYQLFQEFLHHLNQQPEGVLHVLAFELKLLTALGMQPDPTEIRMNPGSRKILEHATDDDWATLGTIKASPQQEEELQNFLHGYLQYHLGGIPRSRQTAFTTLGR